MMSVEVWPTLMSLSRGAKTEELPIKLAHSDHAAVTEYAAAVRREDPSARRVVIWAHSSIPLQTVIDVMTAARGPACEVDGEGCILPEVVLSTSLAHDYRPNPPLRLREP